jgi:hypothetical protein
MVRYNRNCRVNVVAVLLYAMLFGTNGLVDKRVLTMIPRCMQNSCGSGYRDRSMRLREGQTEVCVNPFHYVVDMTKLREDITKFLGESHPIVGSLGTKR